MATWNDLPLEIKSYILECVILAGIKAGGYLRFATTIQSQDEKHWVVLNNLLLVAPTLRTEARKIARRLDYELWKAVIGIEEEEMKQMGRSWNDGIFYTTCTISHMQLDVLRDLRKDLKQRDVDEQECLAGRDQE